jgi:ribulose-5-phosphate 4-epimerase/fuculose-1-phosphate aldolase
MMLGLIFWPIRPRGEVGWCARATEQGLFMANHGVLVVGETVADAYDRLYYLKRACQVQLYAMWTGRPLKKVSPAAVEHTLRQYATSPSYEGKPACDYHFAARKRLLDRSEPDYCT